MDQSDEHKEPKKAELLREIRDLKSKVRGLEAVNKRLKEENAELTAKLDSPGRRATIDPTSDTPVSCIEQLGEE